MKMSPREDLQTALSPAARGLSARVSSLAAGAILALAFSTSACGADDERRPWKPTTGDGAVYALHVVVFDPEFNATSYVALTDTLDLSQVTLDSAREFPGWITIATVGGRLLVANEADPTVTSYEITAGGEWQQNARLSFLDYGVQDAGFGRQWFVNEHKAYVELDVTKRVVWDPTDFVIRGVKENSGLELERAGLELEPGLNRQLRLRKGPLLRPFYYADKNDWLTYAPTSQIASYDPETDEESAIIDAPCPGLHLGTQDEQGRTYFGLWDALPKLALYGQGPKPCVARTRPDGSLDEAWRPDLSTWAGDRFVMVFRYVKDGIALANVLHHEELGADFSGPYDPDVGDEVENGEHYRVWRFDLEHETAQPVEGLPKTPWGFHASDIDGHSFIFLPYDEWGRTRVFEVDLQSGVATERFDTLGWVYDWVRVR